jgi:hypothetical protein
VIDIHATGCDILSCVIDSACEALFFCLRFVTGLSAACFVDSWNFLNSTSWSRGIKSLSRCSCFRETVGRGKYEKGLLWKGSPYAAMQSGDVLEKEKLKAPSEKSLLPTKGVFESIALR